MNGINLHHVVRAPITFVHPDEELLWYHNEGASNVGGILTPAYASPVSLTAQVQSESDENLMHSDHAGMNTETVKVYLYWNTQKEPLNLDRFTVKGGDIFQRADGSYWLVTALTDNFADVGWVSCRATRQINPPQLKQGENDADVPTTD